MRPGSLHQCPDDNHYRNPWWRHQMETFSALLAFCARNSPVTGEFHALRPVTRSFDVFFHLRLNKRLRKQSRGWWSETPSCPLWRQCNAKTPSLQWKTYMTQWLSCVCTLWSYAQSSVAVFVCIPNLGQAVIRILNQLTISQHWFK